MAKVGFVGLGRTGRPMATSPCRKGFPLVVNDTDSAAMRPLQDLQAHGADTVADLAA